MSKVLPDLIASDIGREERLHESPHLMDFVRDDAVQERLETLCFRCFHDSLCGRDEAGASENSHLLELGTEVDDFLIVEHGEALYHYWMEGEAHERLVHDLGDGEIARAPGAHELGQKAGRPAAHPDSARAHGANHKCLL